MSTSTARPVNTKRRRARRLLVGISLAVGLFAATAVPASAAVTATFAAGTLSVFGDGADNAITISRDAAGRILVNGGAVTVRGGTATVANTALIQVFGLAGNLHRMDEHPALAIVGRARLDVAEGSDRFSRKTAFPARLFVSFLESGLAGRSRPRNNLWPIQSR